ncbi:MAG: hypothetical protein NC218_07800 [Acetobacter sp.]|nr:hypothetical protein [Acetobacter sp.]
MLIFCISCADLEKTITNDEIEVIDESCYMDARVVNVLLTTGIIGYGSSSVVYLLLDNGDVIIYGNRNTKIPLTKDEARDIMRFQLGDTVVVKVPQQQVR